MQTGYLIDMDGVIYRENQLIPGAVEFVRALTAIGAPFLFVTYYLGKPNGYMFHRARRKLAEFALGKPEQVVMIGDTMETDIRGAVEAGMPAYLVLTGSTKFEDIGDHVFQPTRVLQSVAELVEEIRTGKVPADASYQPEIGERPRVNSGLRHQTEIFSFHKPRPRPAMTK